MDTILALISERGTAMLAAAVFLESIGLPVPAALALLIAGGAAGRGSLSAGSALGASFAAMLLGDSLMFLLGRYTGWWLLGLLCRISLNPETCILRSANSFYKRGRTLLLVAKFIPGINTLAAPIAGSMNMRAFQFLALDSVGIALYVGAYFSAGFIFSDTLQILTRGYDRAGKLLGWLLLVAIVSYVLYQVRVRLQSRYLDSVPRVSPADAAQALTAGDAVIYDVRSHGYYEADATRIQGASRLEPNAIGQGDFSAMAGKRIYLYCGCVREATSVRVAHAMRLQGAQSFVIEGGLRSWKKAGLPLEPVPEQDRIALPSFSAAR